MYTWKNMVVIPATTFEIALSCDAASIIFFFIFNSVNSIIVNIGYSMPKYNRSTAVISKSKKWFHCFFLWSLPHFYLFDEQNQTAKKNCNVADISWIFLSHCTQLKLYQYLPLTFAHAFIQYICQLSTKELTEFLISALR